MKMILAAVAALAVSIPALAQPVQQMGATDPASVSAGASAVGVIRKLDAKAGSVTLQHGPIAALKWPAMTMAFKADPALLQTLKVGEKVDFRVKTTGEPEIVSIKPAG